METNSINQAHQVLSTQQVRIATEQFQSKVDAKIKEPYKGNSIDVKV